MIDPLDLVDKKYIVMLKNRPHPTYPGVLAAAMTAGLLELSVKLIQAPNAENGGMAICEALARFPGPNGQDRVFQEIGDCTGDNCTPHIAPHRVRMAATRAKGRALRDALGIGVALAEEMSGDDDREPAAPRGNGQTLADKAVAKATAASQRGQALRAMADERPLSYCSAEGCGVALSRDEVSGSVQRGWPLLCVTHGKERKAAEKAQEPAQAA